MTEFEILSLQQEYRNFWLSIIVANTCLLGLSKKEKFRESGKIY